MDGAAPWVAAAIFARTVGERMLWTLFHGPDQHPGPKTLSPPFDAWRTSVAYSQIACTVCRQNFDTTENVWLELCAFSGAR